MVPGQARSIWEQIAWNPLLRDKPGTELGSGTRLLLNEDVGEMMGWR